MKIKNLSIRLFAVVIAFSSVLSFQSCGDEDSIDALDRAMSAPGKVKQYLDVDLSQGYLSDNDF